MAGTQTAQNDSIHGEAGAYDDLLARLYVCDKLRERHQRTALICRVSGLNGFWNDKLNFVRFHFVGLSWADSRFECQKIFDFDSLRFSENLSPALLATVFD